MITILKEKQKLKSIVERHAKFQKVMLIYGKFACESELNEIYANIKDVCVFNKQKIGNNQEVYNGYKLIIFVCTATEFLQSAIRLEEFVNVFISCGEMLPFYLNKNHLSQNDNYLFLPENKADICVVPSVCFNLLYNHLQQLIYNQTSNIQFKFEEEFVCQAYINNLLNSTCANIEFYDVNMLKQTGLDYKFLPLIDYLLTCAICCFIAGIKSENLSIVDVYKLVGQNYEKLNKIYACLANGVVKNVVQLNAHYLSELSLKIRTKILQNLPTFSLNEVENVLQRIKQVVREEEDFFNTLYLYNVFDL